MKASYLFTFAIIALLPSFVLAQSELPGGFSPPETISIGNTTVLQVPADASTESIQRWLDRAIDQSSSDHTVRLEFAPGADYQVGTLEGKTVLTLEQTKGGNLPRNLVIDGSGCYLFASAHHDLRPGALGVTAPVCRSAPNGSSPCLPGHSRRAI
jgi:hypothetical protein